MVTVELLCEVSVEVISEPLIPGSSRTLVVGVKHAMFMPSKTLPGIVLGVTSFPLMFIRSFVHSVETSINQVDAVDRQDGVQRAVTLLMSHK